MTTFIYPAHVEYDPETESYMVDFPDVPGAHTFGDDWTDAMVQAADCLEEAIAAAIDDGDPIPEPSRSSGDLVPVALPIRTALKLILHRTGVGPTALARALDCQIREAQRLLDLRHPSKADRLADAIRAAGGPEVAISHAPRDDATPIEVAGYGKVPKSEADWMVKKGYSVIGPSGYALTELGEEVLLGRAAAVEPRL